MISNTDDAPSCFCEKGQGVCEKHTKFEPTIESMILLLEEQIGSLNKDEKALEENLDFVGKSMDAILFSRRDTFKEQITRAYATKEEELAQYRQRCEELESQEQSFHTNMMERQELAQQNLQLVRELDSMRMKSEQESKQLLSSVHRAQEKIAKDEQNQDVMRRTHKSMKESLGNVEDELKQAKAELRRAQEKIVMQNKKLEKLQGENDLFRKFYVSNVADSSEEHKAEIERVFSDFTAAAKTTGNFIRREIDQLKGVVDDNLKIENKFKPRKRRNLTDSGTEVPSDSERYIARPSAIDSTSTPAQKESGAV